MSRSPNQRGIQRAQWNHAATALESERESGDSLGRLAVTVEEASRMLHVSRATLYKLVMRGEIDSFKVGSARRIAIVALEKYACIR